MTSSGALVGELLPSGRVVLRETGDGAPALSSLRSAFERGTGYGLLHLGAVELEAELDPSLSYWRRFGGHLVAAVCGASDEADPHRVNLPPPDPAVLVELVEAVPPMRGAENVDVALLERLWGEVGAAIAGCAAEHPGGLKGWLEHAHAAWHVAGRICLHLAENKTDPDLPFAFLATWARQVPGRATTRHVPLRVALREYAGARDKERLKALLSPLERAAERSPIVRDLLDSGDVYHPIAWTAEEAHAFLLQAHQLEQAGVVVRLPDWWKRRARPAASVTLGSDAPSTLGLGSLLDFDLRVTLAGEPLSAEEVQALLQASAGLQFMRGQWVEVDREKLQEVLAHWRQVEATAGAGGVSFADAMRMLAGASLDPGEDGERASWSSVVAGRWLGSQLDALRAPTVGQAIAQGAGLNATLRPYQARGVQWLWTLHGLGLGGCLADDMGLGKTLQVIGVLSLLHGAGGQEVEPGTDLLVVPASLIDNWCAELERFAPHLKFLVAHASRMPARAVKSLTADDLRDAPIVITTYGTAMRTAWMAEHPWRAVVLDEAQAIKNAAAKQTRALKKLPSRWRLALTGTPVENRLGDLWSIFDFLNPGLLGSERAFATLCSVMAKRTDDGYAPLRRLVGPYVLRRLKTDRSILADLPDKTELKAWCLLSRPQAVLYEQAVRELAAALDGAEGMQRRGLVLAYLLRFKQICNHPSQWLGDGAYDAGTSGKFERLTELCAPIAERQEKVLVFTQFRTLCDPLHDHLAAVFGRPGLVLHGGVPVKRRAERVARFQDDEEVPFMVLSVKAGGTGLNLTSASHVIHFDRWWNPAVENQATDRAFRIGQRRNVLVHKFVCKGTVEERIDAMITAKQGLSDEILSGGAEVSLTELDNTQLLDLFRLDLHSAVAS